MNESFYNKNLLSLEKNYREGTRGVILEGSSRSGKTWSVLDFLIWICATHGDVTINILKESFNSFKTTLYDDFRVRLSMFPHLDRYNVFQRLKEVSSFKIFSGKINLIGADQPSKFHGAACDFFWINEALPVSQAIFDQLEMRCRRMWILDLNPSVSEHWIFRMEKRNDVRFVHSTMLDNPFIGKWEKKKILSYEPTPENIEAGTADDFMWKVYGCGIRSSPAGVIFDKITWIDEFPDDIEEISFGLDFGFTVNPTAICKVGRSGSNLYAQKLFYAPIDDPVTLAKAIKEVIGLDHHIWCDSASPGQIAALRLQGIPALAAKRYPGSIQSGISLLKSYKLHIVRDADWRREADNYKWREVGGIRLNEPVKAFNHLFDSLRYCAMMEFRQQEDGYIFSEKLDASGMFGHR